MTEPLIASVRAELDLAVAALVDGRGRAGWQQIDESHRAELTPGEAQLVERAVPKRVAEFSTGRHLLRKLLDQDVEILRRDSRAPLLPDGFVGSLSHDDGIAVGVVAPSAKAAAVGIDVEIDVQLADDVASIVVRPDDETPDPLTAFVAKEAAYKAWSSLGGEILEHHDVQLVVDGDSYTAIMREELVVTGQLGRAAQRVMAFVFIPAT